MKPVIEKGNIVEWAKNYDGTKFHALLCDPPYHLQSIVKRFGKEDSAPAKYGKDGAFSRASSGFMGKCYHPDTEILTEYGWMKIDSVDEGTKVATLNPKTRNIEYHEVDEVYCYNYDGNLIHIKHRSAEQMVTPNHNVVVSYNGGKSLVFDRADNLKCSFHLFSQANPISGRKEDYIRIESKREFGKQREIIEESDIYPTKAFMRFLGLWLGDGYVVSRKDDHPANDFFGFSVKKKRKANMIRNSLIDSGIRYTENRDKGYHSFYCYDFVMLGFLKNIGKAKEKYIPEWIFGFDAEYLEELYIGLIETDGCKQGKNQEVFYTSSKRLANDFQELCLYTGRSCISIYNHPIEEIEICGHISKSSGEWTLSILQSGKRLYGERSNRGSNIIFDVPYSGNVFCVEVEKNHILYTRFNGKPVWSGNSWDGGDVAFDPETWFLLGQHLYPGAFGMAFASSRGWHRLAVAIEDAGFIIHPSIFLWTYGGGFPKATRIDNQIDRALGKEGDRKVVGKKPYTSDASMKGNNFNAGDYEREQLNVVEPATDLAKAFEGHRYGLQALKPAAEPIIIFQKPYEGRPVENMMETGAGSLNIDAGRIGINSNDDPRLGGNGSWSTDKAAKNVYEGGYAGDRISSSKLGRWPANFCLQHHPDCRIVGEKDSDIYQINRFTDGAKPFGNGAGHDYESEEIEAGKQYAWACHQDCPVRKLAEQSGNLKSGTGARKQASAKGYQPSAYGKESRPSGTPNIEYGDEGSASRYFYQSDWSYEILEQLENVDPVYYRAKASKRERNAGLKKIKPKRSDYRPNDPDENSMRTRLHRSVPRKNHHPTVKPIELARYLAGLLLPPEIYLPNRRILVPFAGVASEMIGCMFAGWDEILGIELDEEDEYIPIAEQRIDWWYKMMKSGHIDPKEIIKIKSHKKHKDQLELFADVI